MRVIAGSAKRLQLKTIEGDNTRPTTDRIKETLFNMIADELYDCTFLDLFAGSGGIGIEALSRGAQEAVFVEQNRKAMACIQENLAFTRLDSNAVCMQDDVITALRKLEQHRPFDFIFMDPPYDQCWEKKVLEYLNNTQLLDKEGIIIVEASKKTDMNYVEELDFHIVKTKEYKTNKHIFIEHK